MGQNFSLIGQSEWDEAAVTELPVTTLIYDVRSKSRQPFHSHKCHQLIFCDEGSAHLHFDKYPKLKLVDSAVLIPRNTLHDVVPIDAENLCCIYFQGIIPDQRVKKFDLTTLTKELFMESVATRFSRSRNLMLECLYDRISRSIGSNIGLHPNLDPRLQKICNEVYDAPEKNDSISVLAKKYGLGERTLRRLSSEQLGCSIVDWRTECRVYKATRLIQSGTQPSIVHNEVGYSSSSRFITVFAEKIGMTPGRFASMINKSRNQSYSEVTDL